MTGPGLPRRVNRALLRACAVLAAERLWPALWPPAGAALMFLTFAFLDLAALLPGWVHAAVLAGFAAAFAAAARRAVRGFKPVTLDEARRRLEHDSGLGHQPVAAMQDKLAVGAGDPAAQALWRAHQARAAAAAGRLRVSAPAPVMARLDPRALRAAAVLAFTAALGAAWNADPAGRLMRALIPDFDGASAQLISAQVWITPPPYTAAAPVTLIWPAGASQSAGPAAVPAGGAVLARVTGGDAPALRAAGAEIPFESLGESGTAAAWRAETVLDAAGGGGEILIAVISGGETAAAWPVRVEPDRPPVIEYTAPPAADGPRLRLPYEGADDYGVTGVEAVIRRAGAGADAGAGGGKAAAADRAEIRVQLPLARPGGKTVTDAPSRDFSAHLWAGTEVLVTLEASDAAGQTGASEPFRMVLPFRLFNHPVARALADARRSLLAPSPGVIAGVTDTLDNLSAHPARFFDDITVFLGLRVARGRLRAAGDDPGSVRQVQALLWDLAVRIEDGEYALAEREMLEAHDRLRQAMQDGADTGEIERLIDGLMQSLERFLEAAREELARSGAGAPPVSDAEILDSDALSEMIQRARELARLGDMEGARRLMAELGRILQSVQSAARGGARTAQEIKRAREAMDGLRGLSERQRGLLDRNFEQLQRPPGAPPPEGGAPFDADSAARAQGGLRRDLGGAMLRLDELLGAIPGAAGDAERAMRRAEQALEGGDLPGAVRAQGDALSNLQNAMDAAAESIARRLGALGAPGGNGRGAQRRPGADPFGRGYGGPAGAADGGPAGVPDAGEIRRAHEILDELRRRSGDRRRPAEERGYIDRLLKQFK